MPFAPRSPSPSTRLKRGARKLKQIQKQKVEQCGNVYGCETPPAVCHDNNVDMLVGPVVGHSRHVTLVFCAEVPEKDSGNTAASAGTGREGDRRGVGWRTCPWNGETVCDS